MRLIKVQFQLTFIYFFLISGFGFSFGLGRIKIVDLGMKKPVKSTNQDRFNLNAVIKEEKKKKVIQIEGEWS